MKTIQITEETRIPGTNIILEFNDRILYREDSFDEFQKLEQAFDEKGLIINETSKNELLNFLKKDPLKRELVAKIDKNLGKISFTIGDYPFKIDGIFIINKDDEAEFRYFYTRNQLYNEKLASLKNQLEIALKDALYLKKKGFDYRNSEKVAKVLEESWFPSNFLSVSPIRYFSNCLEFNSKKEFLDEISSELDGSSWVKFLQTAINEPEKTIIKNYEKILTKFCNPIESLVFGEPVSSQYIATIDLSSQINPEDVIKTPDGIWDVQAARNSWDNLIRFKFNKNKIKFTNYINGNDGDNFFVAMANALKLSDEQDWEMMDRYLDEIYKKITDPVEIEFFKEPISSKSF